MRKECDIKAVASKTPKHGLSYHKETLDMMTAPKSEDDHNNARYVDLFITSDDKIKENDVALADDGWFRVKTIHFTEEGYPVYTGEGDDLSISTTEAKKVIGTTNPHLSGTWMIKGSIIKEFVERANSLDPIKKVFVKYRSKDIDELRESQEGFLNNPNLWIPDISKWDAYLQITLDKQQKFTLEELKEEIRNFANSSEVASHLRQYTTENWIPDELVEDWLNNRL
jgi:hypothetical protein